VTGNVEIAVPRNCTGVADRMIGLVAGTRISIVAGVTHMRRGFVGLSGMVQTALNEVMWSSTIHMELLATVPPS
jgi:hypothetical protein